MRVIVLALLAACTSADGVDCPEGAEPFVDGERSYCVYPGAKADRDCPEGAPVLVEHGEGSACTPDGALTSELCDALGAPCPDSCFDGERGELETGRDCGGVCPACSYCQPCEDDDDCRAGSCRDGRCVDFRALRYQGAWCAYDPIVTEVVTDDLPAGRYRVSVIPSARTDCYGFVYDLDRRCPSLGLTDVRWLPEDVDGRVTTRGTQLGALQSIGAVVEDIDWPGGDLVCPWFRSECPVGSFLCNGVGGALEFSIEQQCD